MNKSYILGADEVGYGSLAGPLVVCGVCALDDWKCDGLNDSKKLTDKQRRIMNQKLLKLASNGEIKFHVDLEDARVIDSIGISKALKSLYNQVALALYGEDTLMIIDGNGNFDGYLESINYNVVVKADTIIPTVMAASIIAKVWRDDLMIKLSREFPNYGWSSNKGYGSKSHIEAIKKYGYSKEHRKSYKVKNLTNI